MGSRVETAPNRTVLFCRKKARNRSKKGRGRGGEGVEGRGSVEKGRRRGMWGGWLERGEGISGREAPWKRGEPKGTFRGVRTGKVGPAAQPPELAGAPSRVVRAPPPGMAGASPEVAGDWVAGTLGKRIRYGHCWLDYFYMRWFYLRQVACRSAPRFPQFVKLECLYSLR